MKGGEWAAGAVQLAALATPAALADPGSVCEDKRQHFESTVVLTGMQPCSVAPMGQHNSDTGSHQPQKQLQPTMIITGMQPCSVASSMRALQPSHINTCTHNVMIDASSAQPPSGNKIGRHCMHAVPWTRQHYSSGGSRQAQLQPTGRGHQAHAATAAAAAAATAWPLRPGTTAAACQHITTLHCQKRTRQNSEEDSSSL